MSNPIFDRQRHNPLEQHFVWSRGLYKTHERGQFREYYKFLQQNILCHQESHLIFL